MPPREPSPRQLLVEGTDDQHVVWNLCKKHRLPERFTVVLPGHADESGGIDRVLRDIPVRLKTPNLEALGVMIDADSDPDRRWRQAAAAIRRSVDISIPRAPVPGGWVKTTEDKRVGIWLMPNNETGGMLEDFALQLAPDCEPLIEKAREMISWIEAENLRRYIPSHRPKALVHTWLAWQQDPGRPMGVAIQASDLRHDAPPALALIAWLGRLFELDLIPGVA